MKPWVRTSLMWMRTLHVYGSLAAFLLLLFFTVTGWLMMHEEALGLDQIRTSVSEHPLPEREEASDLKTYLRETLGGKGQRVEEEPDLFSFRRAGGVTLVEVDREAGVLRITDESQGLSGKLFDLHRAREGGWISVWMVNLTAFLFVGVSLSGLFLWLPLSRRRVGGILALLASVLLLWVWWTVG